MRLAESNHMEQQATDEAVHYAELAASNPIKYKVSTCLTFHNHIRFIGFKQ